MIKISKFSDIPGWGNFNLVYQELLSTLPSDASILEIGVGYGRGTWSMLDAMTDNMSLYVLDYFGGPDRSSGISWKSTHHNTSFPRTLNPKDYKRLSKSLLTVSQKEAFINNISQHPNFSQVKNVYEISSTDYISQNNRSNFDLVFLDGDHRYETIVQELEYFKDCSLITLHDYYNSDHPGVKKAVHEFLETHNDRNFFSSGSVVVIKKII